MIAAGAFVLAGDRVCRTNGYSIPESGVAGEFPPMRLSEPMTSATQHLPRLLVHTSHQTIRWGDMDALGHVNNTVYFRYMEQARIEWLYAQAKAGVGYDRGTGPVIVNASCTFREPLVFPGEVEVRMFLGNLGRSSDFTLPPSTFVISSSASSTSAAQHSCGCTRHIEATVARRTASVDATTT